MSKPRVKVNKQGQIVIPRRLLEKHGYNPWDWVRVFLGKKHITLMRILDDGEVIRQRNRPIDDSDWDEFFGRILNRRKS